MSYINHDAVKSIRKRLVDYDMRVIRADGVYRHLHFHSTTDPLPGNCAFDVITWPGHAWIGGDWCDGHTIAREHDMLASFLNVRDVSYDYWAEKMHLASRNMGLTKPSATAADEWLTGHIDDLARERTLTDDDRRDIAQEYRWEASDGNGTFSADSLQNMGTFSAENDYEIDLSIDDAWELEFSEYTHDFLVACEGLRFAAAKWADRMNGAVE